VWTKLRYWLEYFGLVEAPWLDFRSPHLRRFEERINEEQYLQLRKLDQAPSPDMSWLKAAMSTRNSLHLHKKAVNG
jgi:hypothetical protein